MRLACSSFSSRQAKGDIVTETKTKKVVRRGELAACSAELLVSRVELCEVSLEE